MTTVVETSNTETLTGAEDVTTVVAASDAALVEFADELTEVNASGDDIVVTQSTAIEVVDASSAAEVVTESAVETVVEVEPQVLIVEAAEQGPPGPAHVEYPGKTITYAAGLATEVRSYLDAAKTILAERRVLSYAGSLLSSIQFFNGAGSLVKTRTLSYSGGVLSGYADT